MTRRSGSRKIRGRQASLAKTSPTATRARSPLPARTSRPSCRCGRVSSASRSGSSSRRPHAPRALMRCATIEGRAATSALLFFPGLAMSVTSPPLAAGGVESEVQRIRALLKQRHFAEAVEAAAALRGEYPENRDVLYLLALGLRHAHRTADALATLQELERHHPGWSLLYQERGHCYVVLKDAPRAIEAYERAVQINPALPATWSLLEGLYKIVGNEQQRQWGSVIMKVASAASPACSPIRARGRAWRPTCIYRSATP